MFLLLTLRHRKVYSSLTISLVVHIILAIAAFLLAKDEVDVLQDALTVESVILQPRFRLATRVKPKPKQPERVQRSVQALTVPARASAAPKVQNNLAPNPENVPMHVPSTAPHAVVENPVTTAAQIEAKPNEGVLVPAIGVRRGPGAGRARVSEGIDAPGRRQSHSGGFGALVGSVGAVDAGAGGPGNDPLAKLTSVPDDKLGAILEGEGADIQGHIRFTRLIHSLADWWQDPSALPSFMRWLSENTRLRADMKLEGGAMRMTNPRILDAPIIVMTGHDKELTTSRNLMRGGPWMAGFTPAERSAMRKYLVERGGMLFFDDCGFKGLFAARVADELNKILPEYPLQSIPHSHEIYSIYYKLSTPPNGSDVYWGSENNPKVTKFKFHKGITVGRRLAVLYNRKDYLCAMETAEIPSRTMLRMRRSSDVHRFMVNMFVYAMKYGGNTDRTGYKR